MKLYPLWRVTIVFKGGGTMTADCRGFISTKDETKWQRITAGGHQSISRCDPEEVVGVVYSCIGWTLIKPAKEFL